MGSSKQPVLVGKEAVASLTRDEYRMLIKLLVEARAEFGVSQGEVARRTGLSQPALSAIDHGTRRLDVIEFMDLAKAIGFDPCVMLAQIRAKYP